MTSVRTFRTTVRQFVQRELAPHQARWRDQHRPDAEAWIAAGAHGHAAPRRARKNTAAGAGPSLTKPSSWRNSLAPESTSAPASRASWRTTSSPTAARSRSAAGLPRMARGELVGAIAHDRTRRRLRPAGHQDHRPPRRRPLRHQRLEDVHHQRLARRTRLRRREDRHHRDRHEGHLAHRRRDEGACRDTASAARSKRSACTAQDTCELFFDDVRVPAANLLGPPKAKGSPR